MVSEEERLAVRAACTRWLSGHPVVSMRERLTSLAGMDLAERQPDVYGSGAAVGALEERTAALLGKPAARFVIKGVIAQQAALRTWAERRQRTTVALHPLSHLDLDELNALEVLHPLRVVRLGRTRPFGVAELDAAAEPIGVVTVEVPLRRAAYALPDWADLVAVSGWCRDRGIPLHLDGARLWETTPGYGRSLAEIAALADSVYVSFYKGLGGLGGCALVGTEDFLADASPWLSRHGANLWQVYPYALSALAGLDRHLPRMPAYHERAGRLASALAAVDGVRPTPVRTNAFVVHLPGSADALTAAHLDVARDTGTWMFNGITDTTVPGYAMAEITVGDATAALTDDEIVDLVQRMITTAR